MACIDFFSFFLLDSSFLSVSSLFFPPRLSLVSFTFLSCFQNISAPPECYSLPLSSLTSPNFSRPPRLSFPASVGFFILRLTFLAPSLPLCSVSLPLWPLEYHSSSLSHLSSRRSPLVSECVRVPFPGVHLRSDCTAGSSHLQPKVIKVISLNGLIRVHFREYCF